MDAVAYIDPTVISFINDNLIPVRLQASDPVLAPRYQVKWTPTLLLLEPDGREQYRTLGFYPPHDLIPSLVLGMAKSRFNSSDSEGACRYFDQILSDHANSSIAPEALYLNGVSKYLQSKDAKYLIAIFDGMAAQYPASPWLTRADPYKYLKG